MLRRFSVNFAIFSMFLDAGFTLLALLLAVALRPYLPNFPYLVPVSSITLSNLLYLIIPLIWVFSLLLTSVYDPQRNYRIVEEIQAMLLGFTIASLICAGILYLGFREFSRWLFVTFVIIDLVLLLSWRLTSRIYFRVHTTPAAEKRVLIVGAGEVGQRVGEMIHQFDWTGLQLVGFLDDAPKPQPTLPILGRLEHAQHICEQHQIDDVVIALPQRAYGQINKIVLDLQKLPIHIRVVPDYFSLALFRAAVDDFGGMPMINLRDPALNDVQRLLKRLFDLFFSSMVLLLALPFIGLVSIAIRLDSKGPMFLRQDRIGENGRIFQMFKFRTMVQNAEKLQDSFNETTPDGKILFKHRNDPRITKVGHFLRRTSLDEIPQLLNVLKGDMSLVGPRPELPWVVELYEPWQHKRFAVPQGMTGWWQVNGRSSKPMHLNTEDDLYYVQNYSLWMDIYILLKTPWVVLRGKGAF